MLVSQKYTHHKPSTQIAHPSPKPQSQTIVTDNTQALLESVMLQLEQLACLKKIKKLISWNFTKSRARYVHVYWLLPDNVPYIIVYATTSKTNCWLLISDNFTASPDAPVALDISQPLYQLDVSGGGDRELKRLVSLSEKESLSNIA